MARAPAHTRPEIVAKLVAALRAAGVADEVWIARDGSLHVGKGSQQNNLDRELAEFEARHDQD